MPAASERLELAVKRHRIGRGQAARPGEIGADDADACRGSPRAVRGAAQIWRVKAATEVLPLVPVTATTVSGWGA